MSTRQDSARNPKYFTPWTLDLSGTIANSQPPSTAAWEGEVPQYAIDCRFQRGLSFQLNCTAITTGPAIIEPQWSIDGVSWNSFSTTVPNTANYSLTITATGNNGYIIDNPWFPWLRWVVLTPSASGNVNIFWAMRN